MKSQVAGIITSEVEVTNISKHGIWLFTGDREFFLSYENFPWFEDASVKKNIDVTEPIPGHFYWPKLDIDLGIESIENCEKFPLISKVR
jgi:hypothetical protein